MSLAFGRPGFGSSSLLKTDQIENEDVAASDIDKAAKTATKNPHQSTAGANSDDDDDLISTISDDEDMPDGSGNIDQVGDSAMSLSKQASMSSLETSGAEAAGDNGSDEEKKEDASPPDEKDNDSSASLSSGNAVTNPSLDYITSLNDTGRDAGEKGSGNSPSVSDKHSTPQESPDNEVGKADSYDTLSTNGAVNYEDDDSLESVPEYEATPQKATSEEIGGEDNKVDPNTAAVSSKSVPTKPAKVTIAGMKLLMLDNTNKVERSWLIISETNMLGKVGLRAFLRMFDENPELVDVFPFGNESKDSSGKLILNKATRRHIQVHASAVMRTLGTCVAGMTSLEDLVPKLRSVGSTHKIAGVKPMHYEILYRQLIKAIKEEVGEDIWDEETENAWEAAYVSITDLIKRPSKRLGTEPLNGWGMLQAIVCLYFTLMTPIRFAGFFIGHTNVIFMLDILDSIGVILMFLDFLIDFFMNRLRIKKQFIAEISSTRTVDGDAASRASGSRDSLVSDLSDGGRRSRYEELLARLKNAAAAKQRKIVKMLSRYEMDRWVPWPKLAMKVVVTMILQSAFVQDISLCDQPGLHWTQLFGLARVLCARRVLHYVQCAENNALLRQTLDADRQLSLRIVKLVVRLLFITHVSACMWCAVTRVELGIDADQFEATPFFPDPDILSPNRDRSVFNSYIRAMHWAFVNLSGIGGVDSVPSTTLECCTVLAVHCIGAVLYAIVTGNVITVLEEAAQNENKIGTDIVKLSNYLKTARVAPASKDRIMRGYMMRNVLTDGTNAADSGPVLEGLIEDNDEILATLPGYLRAEVGIYARAETIRRRMKFFSHCNNNFLVGLSGSLNRTKTLLTGDYLVKREQEFEREVMVVESGTLQVRKDGATIQLMKRGDVIGKSWLIQIEKGLTGFSPVSIRAMSPCVLKCGLSTLDQIQALERSHPVDFQLLRAEARGMNKYDEAERREIAMRGLAKAVRRFKERRAARKKSSSDSADRLGENTAEFLGKLAHTSVGENL